MKTMLRLICAALVVLSLTIALPSRATAPLILPTLTHAPHLFAATSLGSTVIYAVAVRGGIDVSTANGGTVYPRIPQHGASKLAAVLINPSTPVVAWRDGKGVHTAIAQNGAWFITYHGAGTNPQLLTNPLRVVFFWHGTLTCQQFIVDSWTTGCQA